MDAITDFEGLFSELRALLQRLHTLGSRLHREDDLPRIWRAVLAALEASGPLPIPRLARLFAVSRQSMQVTVREMEQAGLIARQANPDHTRSHLLGLTESGHLRLLFLRQREGKAMEALGLPLPPERIGQLTEGLRDIRTGLDEVIARLPPFLADHHGALMPSRIPFFRRKPGVCYALTPDGTELPVVDITHPSFALVLEDIDVVALRKQDQVMLDAWSRKPHLLQRLFFALAKRRSALLQGIEKGERSILSGLNTYLMKLGPEHMDPSFTKSMDPKVARGVPVINLRLRLQNMANLLAEALESTLASQDGRPLRFINIAGGTAMDTINALILLKQRHGEGLNRRKINIQVLDQDINGPMFGAKALAALSDEGGPLNGLDTTFETTAYDWRRPEDLAALLEGIEGCIAAGSSEGGLFAYGSDEEILENLETLRRLTSPEFTLSGSMSMSSQSHQAQRTFTNLAIRSFEPGQFEALAAKVSWRIEKRLEGPTTVCFRLAKLRR